MPSKDTVWPPLSSQQTTSTGRRRNNPPLANLPRELTRKHQAHDLIFFGRLGRKKCTLDRFTDGGRIGADVVLSRPLSRV